MGRAERILRVVAEESQILSQLSGDDRARRRQISALRVRAASISRVWVFLALAIALCAALTASRFLGGVDSTAASSRTPTQPELGTAFLCVGDGLTDVNVRRSPGMVAKPAGDIVTSAGAGDRFGVAGDPVQADGLSWQPLETSSGVLYVAMTEPDGSPLLVVC